MPIDGQGRFYNASVDDTPNSGVPAGTIVTATSTGAAFPITDIANLIPTMTITAVSGTTPSMTLDLQVSPDNGATWLPLPGITGAQTAAGSVKDVFDVSQWTQGRWAYSVSGTAPSFTIGITTQRTLVGSAG